MQVITSVIYLSRTCGQCKITSCYYQNNSLRYSSVIPIMVIFYSSDSEHYKFKARVSHKIIIYNVVQIISNLTHPSQRIQVHFYRPCC